MNHGKRKAPWSEKVGESLWSAKVGEDLVSAKVLKGPHSAKVKEASRTTKVGEERAWVLLSMALRGLFSHRPSSLICLGLRSHLAMNPQPHD